MKLVDDAKRCWRWISVQAMVVAGAVQGAWVMVPDDLKESFPKHWVQWLTIFLLALGIGGRLVQQTPPPPKDSP